MQIASRYPRKVWNIISSSEPVGLATAPMMIDDPEQLVRRS